MFSLSHYQKGLYESYNRDLQNLLVNYLQDKNYIEEMKIKENEVI